MWCAFQSLVTNNNFLNYDDSFMAHLYLKSSSFTSNTRACADVNNKSDKLYGIKFGVSQISSLKYSFD
jgi:hypothetical protein